MRRLAGKGKKKAPAKTLDDHSKAFDERVGQIDSKSDALNKKIKQLKFEINKLPKGSAARRQKENRAKMLLRQRKMYEQHGDQARNQQFNIDQQKFQVDSMQATVEQVRTMKQTKKVMKKQMKKIKIDKIQDLKDDIDDIMEDNNEIQELLGDNPMLEDFNEDELDEELDALDEFDMDDEMMGTKDDVPDYLKDSNFASELPAAPDGNLDPFGLPAAPVPVADGGNKNVTYV